MLYVGGEFTSAGGISANRIARWNGASWSSMATGMSGGDPIVVLAISIFATLPYAGGDFTSAGGITVNNISKWGSPTGIEPTGTSLPENYLLGQNYPNPFNPVTKITFDLPSAGPATLVVYDNIGRVVEVLVDEELQGGVYEINFDGSKLSSGVYYYELKSGNFRDVKKMTLIK